MVFGLIVTGYFWDRTMYDSVGAIRYMEPSWNEVPDGERLWPSLFYLFGLADKDQQGVEQSGAVEETSDSDEVKGQVWTM